MGRHMPNTDERVALLAELGVTEATQRRIDQIAEQLRAAAAQLEAVRQECRPGSDTAVRVEEALAGLDEVLRQVGWRAPGPDGELS